MSGLCAVVKKAYTHGEDVRALSTQISSVMCSSQNASPLYFLKYEDLSVLIKCNRLHKYIPERLVSGL